MKRLLGMMLILTLLYISIQLGFKYFGNGHVVEYTLRSEQVEAVVKEQYVTHRKNERDNYYLEISVLDKMFSVQTFLDYKKYDGIVKDVRYYQDESYTCIYPIFKLHNQVTDVLCKDQDGLVWNYHTIKGQNTELDRFVLQLRKENVYKENWNDLLEHTTEALHVTVYDDNIVSNHYVGLDHYSGIYGINNYSNRHLFNITLFDKDYYDKPLSGQAGRYFVVADYTSTYDFNSFQVVDLVYNEKEIVRYHSKFSFDSYFMGSFGNSIYMFDPSTKKQYEIDAKAKNIKEVGNEQIGIKYYNHGVLENREVSEAIQQRLQFNDYGISDYVSYDRVDKVGTELSGYYYWYKKVENGYAVYRSNVQNKEQLTYLFSVTELANIRYVQDYIYYKEGDSVKYYSDYTGVRTLLKDTEFVFNKSLQFYAYYQK